MRPADPEARPQFISKISIALEEADETVYWLELLSHAEIASPLKLKELLREANELTSIFVSSLRTSKNLEDNI